MLKQLDRYIIKKVLSTYALSILLIISVAIVIDITEKMDDFYSNHLSLRTIILEYYIHFIPYYINLFSSLFTFISVIFVTSKLAYNSEFIAMQASGLSLNRILRPYFLSAAVIAVFTFFIGSYVIPRGNKVRLDFESIYVDHIAKESTLHDIQMRVSENEIAYMERFDLNSKTGYRFSLDKFKGKSLVSRTTAVNVNYDGPDTWTLNHYMKRDFVGLREHTKMGEKLPAQHIMMNPEDFIVVKKHQERLTTPELLDYIQRQSERGRGGLNLYKLEYHKRWAMPCSAFILTLIGVSLSCRKVRGGTGLHMAVGLLLSVTYILFTLVSSSFTMKAGWNPIVSIWMPNVIYTGIALYLYRKAPK